MFSFCFFFHSSSSSAGAEGAKDSLGHCSNNIVGVCTNNLPSNLGHDLSGLLYTPIEELKGGPLFLTLMASPSTISKLSPSNSSSLIVKQMTNSTSSSSLVTRGPSPDRPSHVYKFEELSKSSYNVSTLNRIMLLENVTRQTMSLSGKSQSSLQTHLLQLKPLRDVQSKFEQLNRRVEHLKHVLQVSKSKLNHEKEEKKKLKLLIIERRDEMEERVQLLRSMIGLLNGKRSELDQIKIDLCKCRQRLEVKRAEVSKLSKSSLNHDQIHSFIIF